MRNLRVLGQRIALTWVLAASAIAQDDSIESFLETPDAYFVTQIASVSTFEYVVTFEIYFQGEKLDAFIRAADDEDGPVFEERQVAEILSLDTAKSGGIEIQGCVGKVCRPLRLTNQSELQASDDGSFVLFEVGRGKAGGRNRSDVSFGDKKATIKGRKRALQQGEDLRLFVPAGWATLDKGNGAVPSPELAVVLPRLGENEKSVLGSNPLFEISLSPLTESQTSGASDDGASVYFSGAYKRFGRDHVMGISYSGSVGTKDNLSFDTLKTDFEYTRNLFQRRGDYLPLNLTGGVESDQSFDLVNAVAGVGLEYLLPFNVNRSPTNDYIPNVGPLLKIKAELGTNIHESSSLAMQPANPDEFQRAGYEFSWDIPVAKATVLRIHHAGIWVFSNDTPNDYHRLWDVALQTKIGALDYYIGYQEGAAAPLFKPTETTQVGILIKFGEKYQCERGPDSDVNWRCDRPQ